MGGPAPLPTKLKLLRGIRPDRVNHSEPQAEPLDDTRPPTHLNAEAKRCWRRMVPLLNNMGVLAKVDADELAIYCNTYATWIKAQKELDRSDIIVLGLNGTPYPSPYFTIIQRCADQMRKLLADFGCNPSARSKIKTDPKTQEEIDEYLS